MSNGVLSRNELHAAYRAGGPEGLTHYERLALVEAAVLAKVGQRPKPIYEMHPADATNEAKKVLEDAGYVVVLRSTGLPQFNVVTEREARKRVVLAQRDAYRKGFLRAWEDARACVREKAAYGSMSWDKDRQVPIMEAQFFNDEPEYIYPDPDVRASCDKCGHDLP